MEVSANKKKVLQTLYRMAPFDLKGGWDPPATTPKKNFISCLVCTADRPDDLENLLYSLSRQTLEQSRFEVIVLDSGANGTTKTTTDRYTSLINVQYHTTGSPCKIIGALRNQTLSLSSGEYILFLDDDTRILQPTFLEKALRLFKEETPDLIMPRGEATYGILKARYSYLDRFSYATRCCLFRRDLLEKVGGFQDDLKSYEDIELSIRLTILGAKTLQTDELTYFHPPLYFDSMRKPYSIGQSIAQIRRHYSFLLWLMVYLNAIRFLPYGLSPNRQHQQWFRISLGVLLSVLKRQNFYY